ncbi:hypothetical protein [Mycolicibacter icosiumassiliensis]|uniref:hypothetical protein n=1 Tax=Mycolicibacter icosiumassiliensis TaxID=1792835 RepID=UPI0012B69B81|nr:hypothetical protein [Mycolicibacter icosiumassiliensis]
MESLLGDPSTSGSATASDTASPTDLLSTAVTDFTEEKSVLAGIDVSDAPSDLQSSLTQNISDNVAIANTEIQLLNSSVGPVESTVLADTGPLSSVIDQWFFEPVNQSWANDAQALLAADQGLATAVSSGSESGITTALQQLVGAEANVLPAEFESIPFMVIADLMGDGGAGDAAATSGLPPSSTRSTPPASPYNWATTRTGIGNSREGARWRDWPPTWSPRATPTAADIPPPSTPTPAATPEQAGHPTAAPPQPPGSSPTKPSSPDTPSTATPTKELTCETCSALKLSPKLLPRRCRSH